MFSPDRGMIEEIRHAYHVLESMADLVTILDEEGRYVYANRAMVAQIGHDPVDSFYSDGKNRMLGFSSIPTVRHTKETVVKEEKILDRYYSITTSPIFRSNGELVAFVEVYHDISAKMKLTVDLVNANRKMTDDIHFARNIQQRILPTQLNYEKAHFEARYFPSERLSGDFYDIIPLEGGKIAFYIADVMGHGVTASMVTMFLRQSMRTIVPQNPSPSVVLENLRSDFCELHLGDSHYFTLFYALYDQESSRLIYANAGHTAVPILYREHEGIAMQVKGVPISPVFRMIPYKETATTMESGDAILLYTDGITETVNREGEEFGQDRLIEMMNTIEENILQRIIQAVNRFRWGEMKDDIAMVLMRVE